MFHMNEPNFDQSYNEKKKQDSYAGFIPAGDCAEHCEIFQEGNCKGYTAGVCDGELTEFCPGYRNGFPAPDTGLYAVGASPADVSAEYRDRYRHITRDGFDNIEEGQEQEPESFRRPGAGSASQMSLRAYRKEKSNKNKLTATALVACMIVSGLFGFIGSFAYDRYRNVRGEGFGSPVIYQSVVHTAVAPVNADGSMSLEETAAIVTQAVVEITTETVERGRYFGQFISQGAGSGVIITQDGYIVTNYHVIEGAGNITVRLPDSGKPYTATVVGADMDTDLAVLKIPTGGLTPAVLGDSTAMRIGQTTIAVGNPLGELGGTVTSGIISALDREITIDGQTMSLLQTDAAINPGNSGGGLFNLYGELIGVVNAKSSGSDIEGLGFAIPINTAKKVIEDLISIGYVRGRVSAGLELIDVSTTRAAMRYQVNQIGLYIADSKDSQLKAGDRIVGLNDKGITDYASFKTALSQYKVGDTVRIIVQRGNETVSANIVLTEMRP